MLLESFKIIGVAVGQIILLAAIGFFLIKRDILSATGLDAISKLVMEVTLPLLIFCELVKNFTFRQYANWWVFPLLSIAITVAGLVLGFVVLGLIKGHQEKLQFLSLTAFQNSGYLPLALVAAFLPGQQRESMFIYIFLFLIGFNLVMFSLGVHMICFHKDRQFELGSLFSPPVIAAVFSLALIFFGLQRFIPASFIKSLSMAGDCTLPLAMLVVGGSLAEINLKQIHKGAMFFAVLIKLIIMPALGFWLVIALRLPELIGLLLLIQLSMPSATTLSVITRYYKKEDILASEGIFFTHLLSIVTIPVFLSLYFALVMIR
ncbi:MAG: AEC family transporter [Candidatus Omnitrophica bacterium]|nr:AEC family transporter [Candidatus Omnitrophota bacterium]